MQAFGFRFSHCSNDPSAEYVAKDFLRAFLFGAMCDYYRFPACVKKIVYEDRFYAHWFDLTRHKYEYGCSVHLDSEVWRRMSKKQRNDFMLVARAWLDVDSVFLLEKSDGAVKEAA